MRYVDLGVLNSSALLQKRKRRKKRILFAAGLVAALVIGVFGYAFYWPLSNLFGQIIKNPGIALSFFRNQSKDLKSTDGKTNFLILGIDKRNDVPYTYIGPAGKQEHNGFLSDTVIVASVDLDTKKTSLVSIPRDTWVAIPAWSGFPASEGKINSAYSLGDTYGYPGGGLSLAEKVVTKHIGTPIHYGIRIDFKGFRKAIDTLGGVDIMVDTAFDDYLYPLEGKENASCFDNYYSCRYEHIHFDKGVTHMDGTTALKYARSRSGTNGEGSDFARAHRQQKVIQAFFKKALSAKNLLDPFKLNNLFHDFGETIETDFDLASAPPLVNLAKQVEFNNLKTMVLDPSSGLMYTPDSNLYGGAYVIIPKNGWDEVKNRVKEFLTPPTTKKK